MMNFGRVLGGLLALRVEPQIEQAGACMARPSRLSPSILACEYLFERHSSILDLLATSHRSAVSVALGRLPALLAWTSALSRQLFEALSELISRTVEIHERYRNGRLARKTFRDDREAGNLMVGEPVFRE